MKSVSMRSQRKAPRMYGREEEDDYYYKATKTERKQAASQRNRSNDTLAPARGRAGNAVPAKRKHAVQQEDSEEEPLAANNHPTAATGNHNKYCHFCQHVKVRASSMLACGNQECCRRFCEHCLLTHLNDDVDPMSSEAWTMIDGKPIWNCPICRKKCCCSVNSCDLSHRHCKAYRYRRRRAELASKRLNVSASDKRSRKVSGSSRVPVKPGNTSEGWNKPSLVPGVNFGYVKYSKDANKQVMPDSAMLKAGHPSARGAPVVRRGRVDMGASLHDTLEHASDSDMDDSVENRTLLPEDNPAEESFMSRTDPLTKLIASSTHKMMKPDMAHESIPHPYDEAAMADDLLGGMYGHMTRFGDSTDLDHCEMLLVEENLNASSDLDEAIWLRKTYETVYNPPQAKSKLMAKTLVGMPLGSLASHHEAEDDSLNVMNLNSAEGSKAYRSHNKSPLNMSDPGGDMSELSFFLSPPTKHPRADGNVKEGSHQSALKATVMYEMV
uniref:RING-type domain-containing protein n=1 Tax=Guillardia theta TaxID=55529 RepID=A0A7S4M133_GUITH|mmetsp:Transcript_12751/g.44667  ORF Transcript_12751/g.44667 Transcript_12751/m.44667 type:complete len:497 (+) Transcript_12751:83-1573(+)